jgi:hypothetical protein
MLVGTVADLIFGRIHFDYRGIGFSQGYALNQTDYALAKTDFAKIVEARASLMPLGCNVVRALVSRAAVDGDADWLTLTTKMSSGVLIDAEMTREACNDPIVGYLYRFQDGLGNHTNHGVHCLRDSFVADFTKTVAVVIPPVNGPYVAIADTVAAGDALGTYLGLVRDLTVKASPLGTTPETWTLYSYNEFVFSKIYKAEVGKSVLTPKGHK